MDKKERDKRDYALNREKRLAQMHARIKALQAEGICIHCGKNPKAPHSVNRCEDCLELCRERSKRRYYEQKQ